MVVTGGRPVVTVWWKEMAKALDTVGDPIAATLGSRVILFFLEVLFRGCSGEASSPARAGTEIDTLTPGATVPRVGTKDDTVVAWDVAQLASEKTVV